MIRVITIPTTRYMPLLSLGFDGSDIGSHPFPISHLRSRVTLDPPVNSPFRSGGKLGEYVNNRARVRAGPLDEGTLPIWDREGPLLWGNLSLPL